MHPSSLWRWLKTGGFWVAVLLLLPNCTVDRSGLLSVNFRRGELPRESAIFCDIEKPVRRCAATLEPEERDTAIRLSEAATALAEGRSNPIGLDDSAEALARCGGEPEAVFFEGPFPQGLPVCINCDIIGPGADRFATITLACQARCYDFYSGTLEEHVTREDGTHVPRVPPSDDVRSFCDARARASTNTSNATCVAGACESSSLRMDFADPRRIAEPVAWADLIGVVPEGVDANDLRRTAATGVVFDAGAVSSQWIARGDAWVEFSARLGQSQVVGLSEVPSGCAAPCPDTNPSDTSITFGLMVVYEGSLFVTESAVGLLPGPLGTSVEGERFRVRIRDNGDGTASVRYVKLVGPCMPGTPCNEMLLHPSARVARYPLRVDSSLFHEGATITDARLVRIR